MITRFFRWLLGICKHDDDLIDKSTRTVYRACMPPVDARFDSVQYTRYQTEEYVLVFKCRKCKRTKVVVE